LVGLLQRRGGRGGVIRPARGHPPVAVFVQIDIAAAVCGRAAQHVCGRRQQRRSATLVSLRDQPRRERELVSTPRQGQRFERSQGKQSFGVIDGCSHIIRTKKCPHGPDQPPVGFSGL